MQAIQLRQFGGPEVLQPVDLPVPAYGAGEVLVRVHAAGVNYFEVLMRADRYAVTPVLPMVPGVEVAGVVVSVGDDVSDVAVGDRVAVPLFAGAGSGGYAEFVVSGADAVVPLPGTVPFDAAVALMVQGLTALHLVRRFPPAGHRVLVSAAAGGVGSLLVQLATGAGAAAVIALAGSREKVGLACSLGASAAFNHGTSGWQEQVREAAGEPGVDLIYDIVGGGFTREVADVLAPRGQLAFAALGRAALRPAELERMFAANQSLPGFALLPLLTPAGLRADLGHLFDEASNGRLRVVTGGRFPLQDAGRAHAAIERRETTGKVVLYAT